MARFLIRLFGTFFFSGLSPFAPGTAGSFASLIPLCAGLFLLSPAGYAATVAVGVVVLIAVGIPCAGAIERMENKQDSGLVVIDEAAGQWITFLFIPPQILKSHLWLIAAAFLLFRFFDIVKPPPARQAEKLPGGLGVVADDVMAGLYACLVLNLIVKFLYL